jgi:hypothetical protein
LKRKIAIVFILVMLVLLTACGRAPKGTDWQPISIDGEAVSLVINFDEQTIAVGGELVTITAYGSNGDVIGPTAPEKEPDIYHYTYDDGDITITYPNGATYWESASANGTVSGWDGDYDTDRYVDGMTLAMQLNQAYRNAGKDWDYVVSAALFGIVMIIVGIFMIKDPETMIQWEYGLRFYHVEPTEFYIGATRVSGVVLIAAAVILFLVALYA